MQMADSTDKDHSSNTPDLLNEKPTPDHPMTFWQAEESVEFSVHVVQ
jgi:hypothetical protein